MKVDCRRVRLSKTISRLLFDPLRIALAYLLQPSRSLGVGATRAHLVDRLAQMAGRLPQHHPLVLVATVVDPHVVTVAMQMLIGVIGPVLMVSVNWWKSI